MLYTSESAISCHSTVKLPLRWGGLTVIARVQLRSGEYRSSVIEVGERAAGAQSAVLRVERRGDDYSVLLPRALDGAGRLAVFDAKGRLLQETALESSGDGVVTLQMDDKRGVSMSSGVYFLVLENHFGQRIGRGRFVHLR